MQTHAMFVGENNALVWRKTDLPDLHEGEILIKVAAAGVNRPDLLQRAGLYPPPPGASEALGLEVSGTVTAVGPGSRRFFEGDRVMALVPGGGYAEHAVAHEGAVLPWPDALSAAEAAAFCETAFTVWANVFEIGALSPGERLFVHGATSGIGTMAAAIAKDRGHEVFGTAGSQEKADAAKTQGFREVWTYRDTDWAEAMQNRGGCDVVLDMVGGDYVPRNLAMLRDHGRHVSIAFLRGNQAQVNIMDVMRRRLTLSGSTLRARSAEEKSQLRAAVEAELLPRLAAGQLKPLVTVEVPIKEADHAHRAMSEGTLIGKAVLMMPQSLAI